jgi:hypothetical protein
VEKYRRETIRPNAGFILGAPPFLGGRAFRFHPLRVLAVNAPVTKPEVRPITSMRNTENPSNNPVKTEGGILMSPGSLPRFARKTPKNRPQDDFYPANSKRGFGQGDKKLEPPGVGFQEYRSGEIAAHILLRAGQCGYFLNHYDEPPRGKLEPRFGAVSET